MQTHRRTPTKEKSSTSREITLVENVNLAGQEGPVQLPALAHSDLSVFSLGSSASELDLPATEVVKQPHVGLDEDAQPA